MTQGSIETVVRSGVIRGKLQHAGFNLDRISVRTIDNRTVISIEADPTIYDLAEITRQVFTWLADHGHIFALLDDYTMQSVE
jgi:hypothetical protein